MGYIKAPSTPGGHQLRALRERYGKTQLDVELDANLGIGYLQRLELGKVQHPARDTLERIVEALGATFSERRALFECFGYAIPFSMPTDSEFQWAITVFQAESVSHVTPAYLLDCSHRLLTWNPPVTRLFDDIASETNFALMPELVFNPAHAVGASIINREAFLSAQIHILHYEQQRWGDATAYAAFIDRMRHYEIFDRQWRKHKPITSQPMMTRPLTYLQLDTSDGVLQFWLIAQAFAQDPRFRVIYYLPADQPTTQQCHAWSHDGGEA